MKVGDKVQVIKIRPNTREYLKLHKKRKKGKDGEVRYIRRRILDRTGRIIEILSNGRENQGVKVRFPGGFKWAFHWNEVEKC